MSQRSEAVRVGNELVSMSMNITAAADSYFKTTPVSLIAKWHSPNQLKIA